jgi:hypothetical protein
MAETPAIVIPVGLLRLVPVIVTNVPTGPVVAEKEIIVGAGINVNPASEVLPPGVVRLTAPVDPVPTIATIEVDDTTVNEVTGVPPNVITEVPVKFVPVILINVPAAAVVGANEVMVGAGGKYLYTQAAPTKLLSKKPPTIAVLPSALRETPRP